MDGRDYYQELFNLIQPYLPTSWKKVVLYAEYGVASYSIEFFVKTATGEYVKCFDLPSINEDALLDTFDKMDEVYSAQRTELPKSSIWTNSTITVDAIGKMNADFDYTDLTEDGYRHKQLWKAQHLL